MTADVNNWEPELQELAAQYSPGLVMTAFGVRENIKNKGYRGIGFMDKAEGKMKRQKFNVTKKIEREMNEQLAIEGFK